MNDTAKKEENHDAVVKTEEAAPPPPGAPVPPPPPSSSASNNFLSYLHTASCHEALHRLAEEEFRARSVLISHSHRIYSNIAHRFVTLLEAEANHYVTMQDRIATALQEHDARNKQATGIRDARSTSPLQEFVPTGARGRLYLPASKLDNTDMKLGASPSMSPSRTWRQHSPHRRQQSSEPQSKTSSSSSPSPPPGERETVVSRITLTGSFQQRRKKYAVQRLEQQLEHQAKIVDTFREHEARRAEAFRRREAMLLKKAVENETKNAMIATERGKIQLQQFLKSKPLRLHVADKDESIRTTLKREVLEKQAKARATTFMDLETRQFVEEKQQMFEQRMADLQEAALSAHRVATLECSKSRAQLSSVLVERNIRQGQYQRLFHQSMQHALDTHKRRDHDDVMHVVCSKHAEPIGAEVTWPITGSSSREDPSLLLSNKPLGGGGVTKSRRRTASNNDNAMNEKVYARLCGATESMIRGIGDRHGGQATMRFSDPSLSGELSLAGGSVVQGVNHVGWR